MSNATLTIRDERPEDHDAVHALHVAAFGEVDMPKLVQDLRATDASVSLVATYGENPPLGHVMLSHAWLDADAELLDAMVLSPLAVHPAHQSLGIGTALIEAALTRAEALGAPFVMLEGNHRYYGPRGFEAAEPLGIRRPSLRIPERAFQIAKLSGYLPTMTGTFVYKDVHWRHGVGLYRT